MQHGSNHSPLLFLVVDKLSLIRWANVELAIIATNTLFVVIHVTEGDFTYSHFSWGNSHHIVLGFLLRITILANKRWYSPFFFT